MDPARELAPEARIVKLEMIGLGDKLGDPFTRRRAIDADRICAFGFRRAYELFLNLERHRLDGERLARRERFVIESTSPVMRESPVCVGKA